MRLPPILPLHPRATRCILTGPHRGAAGFECLTVDEATSTLWVMLQSATIQDGGNKKKNARYTRLLAYDVSAPATARPALTAEYVVPLPLDSDAKTLGASEIAFVGGTLFLVLARDSNGAGGDATTSEYKCVPPFFCFSWFPRRSCGGLMIVRVWRRSIDLVDIAGATNIAGSKFDSHKNALAPKGNLDSSITPATYTPFVSLIDGTQLARFGLHNGASSPPPPGRR